MENTYKTFSFPNLPDTWEDVVGNKNVFLSKTYFSALENSLPENMSLQYIGFFKNEKLIGGAILQFLNFKNHKNFNLQKNSYCSIKNGVFRALNCNVMVLGNNMISGEDGFYFDENEISKKDSANWIIEVTNQLFSEYKKQQLLILKDYTLNSIEEFSNVIPTNFSDFEVQPMMLLPIRWSNFEEYYESMKKKYRARVRTAKSKINGIIKKELSWEEIAENEEIINSLYLNVADNAPVNTFYLAKNHFQELKQKLKDKFQFIAYFKEDKMVCFFTVFNNGKELDTYFLGYDIALQKENQLYLNMLLEMVEIGINQKYEHINFGRTALEIKSTIGAQPEPLFGIMKHKIKIINTFSNRILENIDSTQEYVVRSPFID